MFSNFEKFISGPFHVLNPIPQNKEECLKHGNALANSGNYPVGTSECFNVGISGGCGLDCYIYKDGRCDEPEEMEAELNGENLANHKKLYTKKTP